jgi:Ser/Thr protein kinase RdoA (MazF antagonist)
VRGGRPDISFGFVHVRSSRGTSLCDALGMTSALQAAREVAGQFGITTTDPVVLQDTNNTVVWLRPEPVVAKVAVRVRARADLRREWAVATELAALDAEIARPMPGTRPAAHPGTGFVVTFWERLEGADRVDVPARELAGSLGRLHDALGRTDVSLPSFNVMLATAREALDDAAHMGALGEEDRRFLRDVYDRGLLALESVHFDGRRLHGEPHDGNRIETSGGLRWIDFESCCFGPPEWDLAFLPPEVVRLFPEVDPDLLALLRTLNSARVATWCLGGAHHPDMRRHGAQHLELLRNGSEGG